MKGACALRRILDPLCSPVTKACEVRGNSSVGTMKFSREQLSNCFLPTDWKLGESKVRETAEKSSCLGNQQQGPVGWWNVQTFSPVRHTVKNAEGFQ